MTPGKPRSPGRSANPAGEKLQKVLADAGLGSRREIEQWIANGRVVVNGEVAHLGQRAQLKDEVRVDDRKISLGKRTPTQILILNKSAGTVCARRDPEGRPTIFEELPKLKQGRWISVGRLDIQTTGLLLLSNDGALANKMMHPSTGLDREYAARIDGRLDDAEIDLLTSGVEVEGEFLRFSDIQYYDGGGRNHWYHVVLMEGKNREVRRLFEALGRTVSRLKRVRYGPVILPSWLRLGQWASLQTQDIKQISKLLRLPYSAPANPRQRLSRTAKTSCLLPYPDLE
ncbi:MAG: pseudouridine synthase [Pseudomonadota bacterium]